MVTCNVCGGNKPLEEMEDKFRYVCKECWKLMEIFIDNTKIDKDLIY